MTLWSEFLTNNQRGVNKWKRFPPAYETHLARFIESPDCEFLEIGIGSGGSAQLFKRYLGPHAQIISIDINPACKEFEEDQIVIRIGDQADTTFLATVLDEFGRPDVIVDFFPHPIGMTTAEG